MTTRAGTRRLDPAGTACSTSRGSSRSRARPTSPPRGSRSVPIARCHPKSGSGVVDDFFADAWARPRACTRGSGDRRRPHRAAPRTRVSRVVDDARDGLRPRSWSRATPAAGVTVRFASSPADISAYARIAAEAFAHLHAPRGGRARRGRPSRRATSPTIAWSRSPRSTASPSPARRWCSSAATRATTAYVVAGSSCADAARGRGLGDTVTRAVTNEAFRRGADLVTLEASPFGEHTYARMGYREIYRYRMLIRV